ncbi:hypothetical protein HYFRA_00014042 [Hymenoscyphus fraxineus]|uniref:Uncharacterized protein n=1 Tax=Hymenoscyphus fraxineus TaxID=746836 RepID=A0A9N9PVX4_9HELO|nr:hypothetical protein HYFRA_00014042 [Hymenoscyphus fraxineus]
MTREELASYRNQAVFIALRALTQFPRNFGKSYQIKQQPCCPLTPELCTSHVFHESLAIPIYAQNSYTTSKNTAQCVNDTTNPHNCVQNITLPWGNTPLYLNHLGNGHSARSDIPLP